jgi:hypothetical protein
VWNDVNSTLLLANFVWSIIAIGRGATWVIYADWWLKIIGVCLGIVGAIVLLLSIAFLRRPVDEESRDG